MIILIDQDDYVYARGRKNVDDAKGGEWSNGLTITEQWVPDDTVFDRAPNGKHVLSLTQPSGWTIRRDKGQDLYAKITKALDNAQQRKPKYDSVAGLVERVSRIEKLLDIIPEDR